jgi:hypothetical protein
MNANYRCVIDGTPESPVGGEAHDDGEVLLLLVWNYSGNKCEITMSSVLFQGLPESSL